MASKTLRKSFKVYSCIFEGAFGFTKFKFIFLLCNLNELFKPLVLFCYSIFALDTFFTALFIANYIEKNLQRILKTVLEI